MRAWHRLGRLARHFFVPPRTPRRIQARGSASDSKLNSGDEKKTANSGMAKQWDTLIALGKRYPDAIALGQGFPDYSGSQVARSAVARALEQPDRPELNQYSPTQGLEDLRNSIIRYYERTHGLEIRPGEISVTTSGTEALWAAMQALLSPGDEAIVFEPLFPWYPSLVELSGARVVPVRLEPPQFAPNMDLVRSKITSRTRVLLINTPHNPTGHVYTPDEIKGFCDIAKAHNLTVVSDEVYENVVWGQNSNQERLEHIRIAEQPGMRDRTLTIGSASKLFSLTGWRLGWVTGPETLVAKINRLHSLATFCAATPLQHGIARAFDAEKGDFEGVPDLISRNFKVMAEACREKGFEVYPADGGHFLCAGVRNFGMTEMEIVELLLERAGVAVLPLSVFYANSKGAEPAIRIAICKKETTIREAAKRIRAADLSHRSAA